MAGRWAREWGTGVRVRSGSNTAAARWGRTVGRGAARVPGAWAASCWAGLPAGGGYARRETEWWGRLAGKGARAVAGLTRGCAGLPEVALVELGMERERALGRGESGPCGANGLKARREGWAVCGRKSWAGFGWLLGLGVWVLFYFSF